MYYRSTYLYCRIFTELSSLLVRLVAELSLIDHVSGHAGDSSPSSRRSSSGSS
jgi:hypothetical protein